MSTLRDLPKEERPRERLIKYGVETLSLQELFALIFGRGTRGESVIKIAQEVLLKFGSLEKIEEASIEDLKEIKGLGLVKACQLKACFEIGRRMKENVKSTSKTSEFKNKNIKKYITPEDIYYQIRSKIVNYHKEHFLVISLDVRNKIISIDTISIGTLNSNLVHPRETFEAAIRNHAAQIIICHNHPSSDCTPSEDDILITKNLVAAGKILGIKVIDHLVITKNNFFSFAKEKIL